MRRLIEDGYMRGDRFLQLGLRGYWPDHATLAWMRDQGMRSYEMTEIHHRGLNTVLDESFTTLTDGCDGVFLSVDIDVVDPGMAPGTGTPEPGGFAWYEILNILQTIFMNKNVIGFDIVELSYNISDTSSLFAGSKLLYKMVGFKLLSELHAQKIDCPQTPCGPFFREFKKEL